MIEKEEMMGEEVEATIDATESSENINEEDNVTDTSKGQDTSEPTDDASEENKDSKSGKSIFKKDKKEKKDKKDQQIEELNDRLMRTMAEFDNFRKRSEREKAQMFEIGAKDIIEKILPVIDNFERGLATVPEDEKEGAFAKGIEKIYQQLLTTLEQSGVTVIEAVGKEFDPNLHNAVMHAEDENYDENIISEEFQKGYMYRETVVRHSMVKVVN